MSEQDTNKTCKRGGWVVGVSRQAKRTLAAALVAGALGAIGISAATARAQSTPAAPTFIGEEFQAGCNQPVFLKDGKTKTTQALFAGPCQPIDVAIGDFNNDQIPDLAVASWTGYPTGGFPPSTAGGVTILLGDGAGGYARGQQSNFNISLRHIAVADFDNDGNADLAFSLVSSSTVLIQMGHGDGTFSDVFGVPTGPNQDAYALAIGDFNNDGAPDIAVGAPSIFASVSILLGHGDGTFSKPSSYGLNTFGSNIDMAISDLNGDGNLDVAFAPTAVFSVGGTAEGVAVSDFNNDGAPDLAVTGRIDSAADGVSILLGMGDGTFGPATTFETLSEPRQISVADFTGDGLLDLAVANSDSGNVSILAGRGDGSFGLSGSISQVRALSPSPRRTTTPTAPSTLQRPTQASKTWRFCSIKPTPPLASQYSPCAASAISPATAWSMVRTSRRSSSGGARRAGPISTATASSTAWTSPFF